MLEALKFVKVVFSDHEGWQVQCWKIAQTHEKFVLIGYVSKHEHFVDAVCEAYGYDVFKEGTTLGFLPRDVIEGQTTD